MDNRQVKVIISVQDTINYLKSVSLKTEDDLFYQAIINNLLCVILEESDSIGAPSDSLEVAREMLENHYNDKNKAYDISNIVIDKLILDLTTHIDDLDHPKYKGRVSFTYDNLDVIINISSHAKY